MDILHHSLLKAAENKATLSVNGDCVYWLLQPVGLHFPLAGKGVFA